MDDGAKEDKRKFHGGRAVMAANMSITVTMEETDGSPKKGLRWRTEREREREG